MNNYKVCDQLKVAPTSKYSYQCPKCGFVLLTVHDLSKEKGRITLCPKCRTKLVHFVNVAELSSIS